MTILAFEFSSARRSVALARDGIVLAEAAETGGYRVTNAFGLTEKVLVDAKISREEVEVIAIGIGPGSYTGIRAAIAIAQGWQLAREIKLLGISSAEVLAAQAQAEKLFGHVSVIVDAQRGEFYLATWEISADARKEISPLKIVSAAEIEALKLAGEICVGPEMERILFPNAAMLAQLASARTDFVTGEKLEPIYLRETTFVKAAPLTRSY
ncbi:MAG TPA: tRNA (adenosine(37)-N6)-threonylcarbamoyltransferase complex dimerization subunit type 1 TsaB [Verrucomicrobiae bacterium]